MKRLTKLMAQTVAAMAIALFWCISAVGTTVGNDSRHSHAGHRYQRCNHHTSRSQASMARAPAPMAGAWASMAGAWLVWLPLLPSRLVRLPLQAPSGL